MALQGRSAVHSSIAGVHDVTIRRNTMTTSANFSTFTTIGSGVKNLTIYLNIFLRGNYGLMADGGYIGAAAMTRVAGTMPFTNNVIIGSVLRDVSDNHEVGLVTQHRIDIPRLPVQRRADRRALPHPGQALHRHPAQVVHLHQRRSTSTRSTRTPSTAGSTSSRSTSPIGRRSSRRAQGAWRPPSTRRRWASPT